jgi:predicted kinase
MSSLILLRGLPGAGKSTLAKLLAEKKWPIFSVDDYFTDEKTGSYHFNFKENHLAYKLCNDNTEVEMKKSTSKIFIDNTFTLEWEMEPYFELARKYNYEIYVVTVENRHGGSNIHNIDTEKLSKMAEKYKVKLL